MPPPLSLTPDTQFHFSLLGRPKESYYQVLNISFLFGQLLTNHKATFKKEKKKAFKYLVKFQPGQTITIPGNIEQPMNARCPQRWCRRYYFPEIQSYLPKIAKIKKDLGRTRGQQQSPGEKRINNQWVLQNQIHKSLNLERKGQHEIIPFPLDRPPQRPGKVNLVRILSLCLVMPVLPGPMCRLWSEWSLKQRALPWIYQNLARFFH